MSKPTAAQQVAALVLKRDLDGWVGERREAGMAWEGISRELFASSRGKVNISGESLRRWYGVPADRAA